MPSYIIFTQALRAGSSTSVLDGSLDGDVTPCIHHKLYEQCYEYHDILNIAQRVINSSNACGYPSCLLSLHVNTFHGMFVICLLNFDTFVLSKKISR